jgi:long-chain alkane monooxygenase
VIIGDTMAAARETQARMAAGMAEKMDVKLAGMSYLSGIDCSKFDLDAPLPKLSINASRASFEAHLSGDGTRTLREMLLDPGSGGIDFVGTADSIASDMGSVMEEIGGDGFLIQDPLTRKAIVEITDDLVPALQRRGLTRTAYNHALFRDNLLAF